MEDANADGTEKKKEKQARVAFVQGTTLFFFFFNLRPPV
jgi:hypothetical protein